MGSSPFRIVGRSARILVLSAAVCACAPGSGGPAADDAAGAGDTAAEMARRLEIVGASSEIYCDNTERVVGEIRGAVPGEKLVLSSPQPIQLTAEQVDATADAAGAYELTWSCSPTEAGQPWELSVRGQDSDRRANIFFTGTAIDPDSVDALQIILHDDTFVCDGRTKPLGELSNAAAGEAVTFDAELADDLVDGTADAEGRLPLRWQCSPAEAATWRITARGLQSNRVGEFTIVGVAPPPEELLTPTVQLDEDPFVCDGGSRVFATLSGFLPGELVDFVSPQASGLTEGRADDSGDLPIRWTCGPADAGTVWELTATGARSGRTITFTVAGAAPPPGPDPAVTITEDPIRCDGVTRFVATISGFVPREFVDFTSSQADDLRQGQADGTGAVRVRWTCGDDDVDRLWDVTATGATSQRSVSFQIIGAAPRS